MLCARVFPFISHNPSVELGWKLCFCQLHRVKCRSLIKVCSVISGAVSESIMVLNVNKKSLTLLLLCIFRFCLSWFSEMHNLYGWINKCSDAWWFKKPSVVVFQRWNRVKINECWYPKRKTLCTCRVTGCPEAISWSPREGVFFRQLVRFYNKVIGKRETGPQM